MLLSKKVLVEKKPEIIYRLYKVFLLYVPQLRGFRSRSLLNISYFKGPPFYHLGWDRKCGINHYEYLHHPTYNEWGTIFL